ncbi:HNH endonuclease [Pseudomonas sp. RIT623]|uniref:HNH endonuclease n=1 Tax=Pseudomonas sp. RIT623 TaxID=2559075 RepID=UPI0010706198|nr:HNH endonuclease signature motif containing protein [Pseudomonas sp. RIT623]TFF37431.1 HNH endonuclease [Pseudomonas sp. RIT623]
MPPRPQKPCGAQGCKALTRNQRFCDAHADLAKAWAGHQGKGRGGRPWRRLRDKVLKRDHYLCQCSECKRLGRLRGADEVDHIVPVAMGGTDDDGNLQAINHDCHKAKTQRDAQARRQAIAAKPH